MKDGVYLTKKDLKKLILKFKRETELFQYPKTEFCKKYGNKLSCRGMEEKWMEENIDTIPTSRVSGGLMKKII